MTWEEMYEAVINNDPNYDTLFFYAVKSTGIFCRPSCKSRAPKKENIVFFHTAEQARAAGYRPCKRCRSDLLEYKPMQDMADKIKKLMDTMPLETSQLQGEMSALGLSHKRVVEIFKDAYGITPHAYMNNLRFAEAKALLKHSDAEIIDIAFSVGFSSLSAFYAFFKARAKLSPVAYRKEQLD